MKAKKVRYAVVAQGHISQVAVLPAFRECKNSELVALVSGDKEKLKALSKKYGVKNCYSYEEYDKCLKSGEVDAVYISLPNQLHREYSTRAAEAGIHILCEKPLAVTSQDCEAIAQSVRKNKVKLMVAYRLHFDAAHLNAIEIVNSGKIGEICYFSSEFGYQLKEDNIRALPSEGGSPLHDMGIYCINAVRYLFKSEPEEVFAFAASPNKKLSKIHQTVTVMMKFPGDKLANFTCSFASSTISNYRVVGTRGNLFIENAYEYVGELKHRLTVKEKLKKWKSKAGDQFSAEITYFSECLLKNKVPEPSLAEGTVDVKIIEALQESIQTGKPVKLSAPKIHRRPTVIQKIYKKPHREPQLIKVEQASK